MDVGASHRMNRKLLRLAHIFGLIIAMTILCGPGLWIVLNSLRPTVEIMSKPPVWIPQDISLSAYYAMFGKVGEGAIPVGHYFRNSLTFISPRSSNG